MNIVYLLIDHDFDLYLIKHDNSNTIQIPHYDSILQSQPDPETLPHILSPAHPHLHVCLRTEKIY